MPAEYRFEEEGCWITEWWNHAQDPAASIVRARVAPACATRWHRLTGITERYVVLAGRGCVELGTGVCRQVGPDDVVLIPAGTPQRITNTGSTDLVFLAVCTPRFRPDAYAGLDAPAG